MNTLPTKEQDSEDDIERALTDETNFHAAREESIKDHYAVSKVIDDIDGSWNGLWCIMDRKNKPLPKELQGSFTEVPVAINLIKAYLKNKENTNV